MGEVSIRDLKNRKGRGNGRANQSRPSVTQETELEDQSGTRKRPIFRKSVEDIQEDSTRKEHLKMEVNLGRAPLEEGQNWKSEALYWVTQKAQKREKDC